MIAALGLLVGVILGLIFTPDVPAGLDPYLPIAVVAALDAVFGALRAYLEGIFDDKVFVVSFFSNVVIAAAIVYLGDKLGVGGQLSTGRDRRPRHPDLLQRRPDQAVRLPCLTTPTSRGLAQLRTTAGRRADHREPRRRRRRSLPTRRPPRAAAAGAAAAVAGPDRGRRAARRLGFAAITQVRTNTTDNTYAGYREQDLVDVLSALAGTSQRAQTSSTSSRPTRRRLEAEPAAQSAALAAAQKQAEELASWPGRSR